MKTAPKTLEVLAQDVRMSNEFLMFILTNKAAINGKEVIDITKYEIPDSRTIDNYAEIFKAFSKFIRGNSKCKQKIIIPTLSTDILFYYCSLNKGDIKKMIEIVNEYPSVATYLTKELNQCDGILIRQVKGNFV